MPARLGDEGDAPRAGPSGGEAAGKIGEPVGERGQQAQMTDTALPGQVWLTPASHTPVASTPAASSMRMLTPIARSASWVDGQAPRRRPDAARRGRPPG